MSHVRIGMLGCGPRGASLTHSIAPIGDIHVTAMCDLYATRIDECMRFMPPDGTAQRFTDHRKMLRDAPVDAVYVVVEPEHCVDLVVECLEAGKHVLSDVPMSFTLEGIWRIVKAVEKTGLKYMLGESTRYWPFITEWKRLVDEGTLGKALYAEGQYMHGMTKDRFYVDPDTGARLSLDEAERHPKPKKSRLWKMAHPILYLPHEISPLLRVLSDRVVSVVCMGTRGPSYKHAFFPHPDVETALMRTEKDTILRLSACFTAHQPRKEITMYHWYSVMGTKGSVETHRTDHDKMKLVVTENDKAVPREVWYDLDRETTPAEILNSGHSGIDYFAIRAFADCVINDTPPPLDVYGAAETAAPAIAAARSAELDGERIAVPDFRPGLRRQAGEPPIEEPPTGST